jgi:hypothetical protein
MTSTSRTVALFAALVVTAACSGNRSRLDCKCSDPSQAPLLTRHYVVAPSSRPAFFEAIDLFAHQEAFAIRVAPNSPAGDSFTIQLWREDVKAIGVNSQYASQFNIYFYANSRVSPLPETLAQFGHELDSAVSASGATVLKDTK